MTDDRWDAGTWEGARREQLRSALRLTVRERLQNLEGLYATGERLAAAGRQARERSGDPAGRIRLEGCRPTPLASYLKALGVLRLVVEQEADPDARGHWDGDRFVLTTRLGRDELVEFFLEEYHPTPIVGPWGARSGFYGGSSEASARAALDQIVGSTEARLAPFRGIIESVRHLLREHDFPQKPQSRADKLRLLQLCRSQLPDDMLRWLDACYVLTGDDREFPPLLGTGGNEGSGSYTSTFAQLVVDCILSREHDEAVSTALLGFSEPIAISSSTPGHFSGVAVGGPNAGTGFSGDIALNPWDYLLCLEGTLLFAASATRRLEGPGDAAMSFPFTVAAIGAGTGGTALGDEDSARGEIWMPLWEAPASLVELKAVLAEGRATVGRRNARDGLDFARAANSLGVARGVSEFQRFGFLQRYGRTFLATPLNRVPVKRNVAAGLIDQLERRDWLSRFRRLSRRSEAPARLGALGRRLDDALFDLALRGDTSPRHAQEVLTVLGRCMRYLAISPGARERCRPVPLLDEEWVRTADDGTAEFLLAAALAGLHARSAAGAPVLPMVVHAAPVQENRRQWTDGADHQVVWGQGGAERNLGRVLSRRLLTAGAIDLPDRPLAGWAAAPIPAVGAWLAGRVDSSRLADLMLGLALARSPLHLGSALAGRAGQPVPGAYRLMKPFFTTNAQLERIGLVEPGEYLPLPETVIRSMRTGDVETAVRSATRRLRASGYATPDHLAPTYADGERLLAALMVPVSDAQLRHLLAGLLDRPDETTTHELMEDHHAR